MTNKVEITEELFELIVNTIAQEVPYAVAAALLERLQAEFQHEEPKIHIN
jgi:hypothetical protein